MFRDWLCWKLKLGWELEHTTYHLGSRETYSSDPCEPIRDVLCRVRRRHWRNTRTGEKRHDWD